MEFAYQQIKSDKWAWAHCIGFTSDKFKSDELCNILSDMGINYLNDEIPYYGTPSPVYRVFVFGCDIEKTRFLKEKFCTENT